MKHRVLLSPGQRSELKRLASSGRGPVREALHARILLETDAGGPALTDREAARAAGLCPRTVARIRALFCRDGLEAALARRPQPPRPARRALSDAQEALLVALACSEAPAGHARWSVRLLADRIVEAGVSEGPVSRETVRAALKKTRPNPGASSAG